MLKAWILNLDFVKRKTHEAFDAGFAKARENDAKIREYEKEELRKNFLHVGGEVLAVSNEWEAANLIHGVIVSFDEHFNEIPMVQDVSSGKVWGCPGLVVPYHPELHAALKKLNPFERWSVMIARTARSKEAYIFDKAKREPDLSEIIDQC